MQHSTTSSHANGLIEGSNRMAIPPVNQGIPVQQCCPLSLHGTARALEKIAFGAIFYRVCCTFLRDLVDDSNGKSTIGDFP